MRRSILALICTLFWLSVTLDQSDAIDTYVQDRLAKGLSEINRHIGRHSPSSDEGKRKSALLFPLLPFSPLSLPNLVGQAVPADPYTEVNRC